jgi:hypothetical protein
MPSDSVIVAILGLIGTSILGPIITYWITREKTKREFYDKALQDRLHLLYSPLRAILIDTHITRAGSAYPFKYRFSKALPCFKQMKIREGIMRLGNKFHANVCYEVEFGANFPLTEIEKIVKDNIRLADEKLISMVQRAGRASYERWDEENSGFLAEEKAFLADYIITIYQKLTKRLLPEE